MTIDIDQPSSTPDKNDVDGSLGVSQDGKNGLMVGIDHCVVRTPLDA